MSQSKENLRIDADLPLTSDRIPLATPGGTKLPPWTYLDVTVCEARMSQFPRSSLSRRKTSSILPLPELLLVCVAANGSITRCLTCYPTENSKISDSPPLLAISSDPIPGGANHTGAIVGGKLVFGGLCHTTSCPLFPSQVLSGE